MSNGPTYTGPQCLSACAYLGLTLCGRIHGIDLDEVLAPNWQTLLHFKELHALHREIVEMPAGSFREIVPPETVASTHVVTSLDWARFPCRSPPASVEHSSQFRLLLFNWASPPPSRAFARDTMQVSGALARLSPQARVKHVRPDGCAVRRHVLCLTVEFRARLFDRPVRGAVPAPILRIPEARIEPAHQV
jgi:hypothetical protein